ncbi:MAG: hypothetical protein AAFO91_07570, partial [Bacteroidota bacterium]
MNRRQQEMYFGLSREPNTIRRVATLTARQRPTMRREEDGDAYEHVRPMPAPQQMSPAGPSRRPNTIHCSSNREFIAPPDANNLERAHPFLDSFTQLKATLLSEAYGQSKDQDMEIPNYLYDKGLFNDIDFSRLWESADLFELRLRILEPRLNESQKFKIASINFPFDIIEDYLKQIRDPPTFYKFKKHIHNFYAPPKPSVYNLDNVPAAASNDICSLIRLTACELNEGREEQLKAGAIRKAPADLKKELSALAYLPLSHFLQAAQAILDRQSSQKDSLYKMNQPTNAFHKQRSLNGNVSSQYQHKRFSGDFVEADCHRVSQRGNVSSQNICYYHRRWGPRAEKCESYNCAFYSQTFSNVALNSTKLARESNITHPHLPDSAPAIRLCTSNSVYPTFAESRGSFVKATKPSHSGAQPRTLSVTSNSAESTCIESRDLLAKATKPSHSGAQPRTLSVTSNS